MTKWSCPYCNSDTFETIVAFATHKSRCPAKKRHQQLLFKAATDRRKKERNVQINGKCTPVGSSSVTSTVKVTSPVNEWTCVHCGKNDFKNHQALSNHKSRCRSRINTTLNRAKTAQLKTGGHGYGQGASVSSTFSHLTHRTRMNSDNQKKQDRGVTYDMNALYATANLRQ